MEDRLRRARFERLVDEVHDPLARYLRRRSNAMDADDVMGDVLLTLWRRLDSIPEPTPLPWCYGVARRALANHRRGERRRLRLVDRLSTEAAVPVHDADPDADGVLAASLERLPDTEREVLKLWAWEQLEPREIASVLGTSANAVSVRLSRAKKRLAREMVRKDPARAGHKQGESPQWSSDE